MQTLKDLLKSLFLRVIPSIVSLAIILMIVKYVVMYLAPEAIMTEWQNRMIRFGVSVPMILVLYLLIRRYWFRYDGLKVEWMRDINRFLGYLMMPVVLLGVVTILLQTIGWISFDCQSAGALEMLYPLITMLFAVMLEEVIFRGIFYAEMRNVLSWKIMVPLSGLIFGLMHAQNPGTNLLSILSAALGGVILSLQYERYRSILAPFAFHLGWNLYQAYSGSPVSGLDLSNSTPFVMRFDGPAIMTGAPTGLESSLITLILLTVYAAWLVVSNVKNSPLSPLLESRLCHNRGIEAITFVIKFIWGTQNFGYPIFLAIF